MAWAWFSMGPKVVKASDLWPSTEWDFGSRNARYTFKINKMFGSEAHIYDKSYGIVNKEKWVVFDMVSRNVWRIVSFGT